MPISVTSKVKLSQNYELTYWSIKPHKVPLGFLYIAFTLHSRLEIQTTEIGAKSLSVSGHVPVPPLPFVA
jgi:hypothetical protein